MTTGGSKRKVVVMVVVGLVRWRGGSREPVVVSLATERRPGGRLLSSRAVSLLQTCSNSEEMTKGEETRIVVRFRGWGMHQSSICLQLKLGALS